MGQIVTQEYIDGILEGREYKKRFNPDRQDIDRIIENIRETMKIYRPGPVKDMLRGELDFWKAQIK